jgi:hypothetical protein
VLAVSLILATATVALALRSMGTVNISSFGRG